MPEDVIRKMVHLARLKFPEGDEDRLTAKAKAVIAYVNELQKLDTTDIEPTSHAVEVTNGLREDHVIPSTLAEAILALAPEREGDHIQVPQVIES